jgi:hypothetical protein
MAGKLGGLTSTYLKPTMRLQMLQYKRQQVEEAVARVVGGPSAKPSSELRSRLKRLLDTDRGVGRNVRSSDPEVANFAFYSSESPGKGVEVSFSSYEALALLVGLQLLEHGWPQSFAVAVLRRVRREFERQHVRFLNQDRKTLFDPDLIRQKARPGDLYVGNTDPVFLVIASGQEPTGSESVPTVSICRGTDEVAKFARKVAARSWTLLELVTSAHSLSTELSKVKARKRGRSG